VSSAHPVIPDGPEQVPALPTRWSEYTPEADDVDDLAALLRRHEREARGFPGADSENVSAEVTGRGARTRTHLMMRDEAGKARAWVTSHDRAAGRVLVGVTVDPDLADEIAGAAAARCYAVALRFATRITDSRAVQSHMDSGAFAEDERQQGWLRDAGFDLVRHWWQMSRPVDRSEAAAPTLRQGVVVRRVRRDDAGGMPHEQDLRDVHNVLEASFTDHFNSYRETFDEFVGRLREDPGHRWDHWWIATVDGEPAGALVGVASTGRVDESGNPAADGSYVEYIGVSRNARGRGVAKALLYTVIADAAERGRDRVGLEVDADSPTNADGLYTSMGWTTKYVTQSWHKGLDTPRSSGGNS